MHEIVQDHMLALSAWYFGCYKQEELLLSSPKYWNNFLSCVYSVDRAHGLVFQTNNPIGSPKRSSFGAYSINDAKCIRSLVRINKTWSLLVELANQVPLPNTFTCWIAWTGSLHSFGDQMFSDWGWRWVLVCLITWRIRSDKFRHWS